MISITVQGDNLSDIQKKIKAMFPDVEMIPTQTEFPIEKRGAVQLGHVTSGKKRGPKPKVAAIPQTPSHETAEALISELENSSTVHVDEKVPVITDIPKFETIKELVPAKNSRQDIHQALQKVNVERGLAVARDILLSFGANRVSELRDHQFDEFVGKCEAALRGK